MFVNPCKETTNMTWHLSSGVSDDVHETSDYVEKHTFEEYNQIQAYS